MSKFVRLYNYYINADSILYLQERTHKEVEKIYDKMVDPVTGYYHKLKEIKTTSMILKNGKEIKFDNSIEEVIKFLKDLGVEI